MTLDLDPDYVRALRELARVYVKVGTPREAAINLKVSPVCDPLRGEARFQDLLRRMNFPQ